MAALRTGVKTSEHGHYLDQEAADFMLEKQAILVPTISIAKGIVESAEKSGLPEFILEKARTVTTRLQTALRLAVRKGVPIALGSDIGTASEDAPVHWGANGRELAFMVEEAGMSPLEAIRSATAMGPATLGP